MAAVAVSKSASTAAFRPEAHGKYRPNADGAAPLRFVRFSKMSGRPQWCTDLQFGLEKIAHQPRQSKFQLPAHAGISDLVDQARHTRPVRRRDPVEHAAGSAFEIAARIGQFAKAFLAVVTLNRLVTRRRSVPAVNGRQWRRVLDKPVRQRLEQCGIGALLLVPQQREDRQERLPDTRRSQGGRVRLHPVFVQYGPSMLDHRLRQPVGFERKVRLA